MSDNLSNRFPWAGYQRQWSPADNQVRHFPWTGDMQVTGVQNGSYGIYNVRDFGARGDGHTDDTAAVALAAQAIGVAGGGVLYFPPGTYIISSPILLPSGTMVLGDGLASIIKAIPGAHWVPGPGGSSDYIVGEPRSIFLNENWASNDILDEDYKFYNFCADLDTADSVQRKTLATMVSCRNTEFSGITTRGGGTVVQHLHTENSNIHDCAFFDCHGSACDHYSGFKYAWVTDCFVRQTAVSSHNPALQFTGTNNNNTFNTSEGVICTGNRVICTGGFLSSVGGISVTAAGAGGVVNNVIIANNDVDMDGLNAGGILCYGGGDDWSILGNSVRNVSDYNCIFALGNGYGTVTRVHAANNRVLDSSRTSGSGRILTVDAVGSTVVDNDILNCVCTTGIAVIGNGSLLRMGSLYQSTYTNAYTVSGSVSVDGEIVGTWTPQLRFGGGTTGITYSTRTGVFVRQGNMVYLECTITLTNKGSSTGQALLYGIPFADVIGSTPPSRLLPTSYLNTSGLTGEPFVFVSDDAVVLRTAVGGSNLDDTNFNNNTTLAFCGWYRTG